MDDIAAGDQGTALCDDNAAANDKCTYGQTDRCSDGQMDGTYRLRCLTSLEWLSLVLASSSLYSFIN